MSEIVVRKTPFRPGQLDAKSLHSLPPLKLRIAWSPASSAIMASKDQSSRFEGSEGESDGEVGGARDLVLK